MSRLVVLSMIVAALAAGACRGRPPLGAPEDYEQAPAPPPDAAVTGMASAQCVSVQAESLPARRSLFRGTTNPQVEESSTITFTRARLYSDFKQRCGGVACHGVRDEQTSTPSPLARSPERFTLTQATFDQRPNLGTDSYARILSADPNLVMPPDGSDGSKRAPQDPVRLLGERLLAWEEAGYPDSFTVSTRDPGQPSSRPGAGELSSEPYRLTPELGAALTNIGSCLPKMSNLAPVDEEMAERDALFARARSFEDLPETLVETDLVSLDSEVLARRRVFSFAPTYTLFSDSAAKMRHVRVPVGRVVSYDPDSKEFVIPTNTRFYKTFLRKVIDRDGNVGYRKIETRLIVSRPDERMPDGSYQVRSLMVVYAWDRDERMARKVTDPTRDQQPWADRICPYVTDESVPRDPETNPIDPQIPVGSCTYMTEAEMDDPASGKVRHYAIPGKERCIQCHMGATNHSFILGFTPLQVDRRPAGQGGVYEDPTEDELGQLQRLLDYGVVEGLRPGEAKLETSQGDRRPRNDYELRAQGYMMGNCAFCHNPVGFPTVENPILRPFDLYPRPAGGGVFGFPLDFYSERVKAGPAQVLRYPYITPWLGDFTETDTGAGTFDSLVDAAKYVSLQNPLEEPWPVLDFRRFIVTSALTEPFDLLLASAEWERDRTGTPTHFRLLAPWRSLIWRNVSTPFTYVEENSIFIHMPRHVPGFDCRAPRIMADWMISVPSAPAIVQRRDVPSVQPFRTDHRDHQDGYEQPYQEVRPGDRPYRGRVVCEAGHFDDPQMKCLPIGIVSDSYGYEDAVLDAERRLAVFRASLPGQHCPEDLDIVDPRIVRSGGRQRIPRDYGRYFGERADPKADLRDRVPDHAHFFSLDTTEPPGPWVPRRRDWKAALVEGSGAASAPAAVRRAIAQLASYFPPRDARAYFTQTIPMGLWAERCQVSRESASSRTLSQLREELPRRHFWPHDRTIHGHVLASVVHGGDRVHSQSRGEAIFRTICMNCHGRAIDSKSPLAATIAELTGGATIVANLRDGILGPVAAAGASAQAVFSSAGRGGTAEDWKLRYLLFMGLGGTLAEIPASVVSFVSSVPFYGRSVGTGAGAVDGNMLEPARDLCGQILALPRELMVARTAEENEVILVPDSRSKVFARDSGHFQLWHDVCSFDNEQVVHVLVPERPPDSSRRVLFRTNRLVAPSSVMRVRDTSGNLVYPPHHPVGTVWGTSERGVNRSNQHPWCVFVRDEAERALARAHFADIGIANESDMPFCPATLMASAFGRLVYGVYPDVPSASVDPEFVERWARRGAMNAGTAAYHFMDGVVRGELSLGRAFDECSTSVAAVPGP